MWTGDGMSTPATLVVYIWRRAGDKMSAPASRDGMASTATLRVKGPACITLIPTLVTMVTVAWVKR